MTKSFLVGVVGAIVVSLSITTVPASADGVPVESKSQHDARMQWWRQARFGMFIHWGLYAVPAGTWQGKPIPGIGEWIMDRANIPVSEYEQLAKKFNPVKFDPDQWVRVAKEAGVRYIVITSKHHDGFSLFDSKTSNYDVVDATPYGKSLLKPLSAACKRHGVKFCTYYSIMDWHHPAQYRASDKRYNPTRIHADRKAEYLAYMKAQLKELLDNCDPAVMWFDGEWPSWWTEADGRDIYAYLRTLKPEIIVNNRVGKGRKGMEGLNKGDRKYVGDFGTPEQQIPATGLSGVDWESCMTMNDTWGFKSNDQHWKSVETLVRNIINTASKGGNYLLNVGPTAAGEIPAASVERLHGIGRWMQKNSASIYGTVASPLTTTPWGRCTAKQLEDGKLRLYLHVFDWPADGTLSVAGTSGRVVSATLLDGGQKLRWTMDGGMVKLAVPRQMPDPIATVIVLTVTKTN